MSRSFLQIKKGDLNIYFNNNIYLADAIIIDISDAALIFHEFSKYEDVFTKLRNQGTKIYLQIDMMNKKKCYQDLKATKGEFISGWVIPHSSSQILNSLVIKVREYELKQKLNFGTLHFIAIIDTPEGIVNYRKIASYERVKAIIVDEKSYDQYLGLDYHPTNTFIRGQIALNAAISKKPWIDTATSQNAFEEDLINGKNLGAGGKVTTDMNQLPRINQFYTPSNEEILNAKEIYETYIKSPKKNRKNLIVNEQEISPYKIIRSQELLLRAQSLNLETDDMNLNLVVKGEKIKEYTKILPKKFYTYGEEIGNAITHGVGILFSIVYLILLMIKGVSNQDSKSIIAYIIYVLSAFFLYLASTLYHGLPLGGKSKKLFQKFDHMSIYLLIAGTYTPFTLLAIGGSLGTTLCIILWSSALIGLFLNVFWFDRFMFFHMILYLAMGWVAIFYLGIIIESITTVGTILLIAGGVSYTLGILFYALKLFKFSHMVWHIFVLAGTLLHFFTIYLFL